RRDEFLDKAAINSSAARQFLELFVRAREPMAPHQSLNSLRDHFPRLFIIQVFVDASLVHLDPIQAAFHRGESDDDMAERGADRAQGGRVSQIALPSGDRKLAGK